MKLRHDNNSIIFYAARLLTYGFFFLTKFISNNGIISKNLSREILSSRVVNLDLKKLPNNRVLGITWDSNTDMLKFNVSNKVVSETKKGRFKCSKFDFRCNGSHSSSDCESQIIN